MSQTAVSSEWLNQLADPHAVLGLSVTADGRRVLKRYHAIAKQLHPDQDAIEDSEKRERADKLLSRAINPAYSQIKLEKGRAEAIVLLRLRARRLSREEAFLPQGELAQQLLRVPAQDREVFYEQAVVKLAELQFTLLHRFEDVTQQINELNLLYLHLKTGETEVLEKRTGIVSATQAKPTQFTPPPSETVQMAVNYGQRHYQRAQEYAKKGAWSQVVAELRDAIRLEATRSEYHSLLAHAYWMQNLPGMAKVHLRQALKFNPNDPLAKRYAAKLDLAPPPSHLGQPNSSNASIASTNKSATSAKPGGGFLGNLFSKRK